LSLIDIPVSASSMPKLAEFLYNTILYPILLIIYENDAISTLNTMKLEWIYSNFYPHSYS